APTSAAAPWRHRLKRLALTVAITLLGGLIVLTALQRYLLFPRHGLKALPHAGDDIPGLERWWIDIYDGRVEAWFLPGDSVSADHPGPAVIFAHGNGELIDDWPESLAGYRRLGISVLLPEYRGYGRSSGSPSEETIVADVLRFRDRLTERKDVDATRILYHGRSLGGGVIAALAAHHKPRAMILQSTFTSLPRLVRRFLVPGFIILDHFDTLAVVKTLDIPILVLHGTSDRLIPAHHGETLARAAHHGTLRLYPEQPHNFWPPTLFRDIAPFLRETILAPRGP
ncbi:MAG: alpha/beta hydrolase, partial [Deltaproteobacteria bacterium]|nr:alpha/beta hydrolase [Deltaproteobacteria bacterium]